jgi:nucleoside-diphosphate-sugar epimerase
VVNISSVVAGGWPSSQSAPYRAEQKAYFSETDLFYSLAKNLGESIGNAYHQAHGLDVIHLRPGMIAGDGANAEPPLQAAAPFWFIHVAPEDVAQAVEAALETKLKHGTFQIVAGREDALFDWQEAAQEIGYTPSHNWPSIPIANAEKP